MRTEVIGSVVQAVKSWNPHAAANRLITYLDLSSVDNKTKLIVEPTIVDSSEAPSRARQIVSTGDVLVSTVRPNLNAVAWVPPEFDGATASTGFCVLRPREEVLDGRYLFHWVRTGAFVSEMERLATGANYPAVSDKIVHGSAIPLPPIDEQRRIASILDAADALRAKRRQALETLDTLTQAIFLDIFGKRVPGSDSALGDLADSGRGTFSNGPFGSDLLTSELTETGVPVIYIRDIREGVYKRVSASCVTEEKAAMLKTSHVHPGDVLIAKVGDPPGVAAVYPPGQPLGVVTQDVVRMRTDLSKALPEFIVGYLNSPLGARLVKTITVEATRARFGLRDLKALSITVPPLDLQYRYRNAVLATEAQHARLTRCAQGLDRLFASLQHRAFRGEL